MALINSLPPELLVQVFLHACRGNYAEWRANTFGDPESFKLTSPYHWIYVTHVCCYWRHIALSCPGLWNNIIVSRPRFVRETLRRSASLPLSVSANPAAEARRLTAFAMQFPPMASANSEDLLPMANASSEDLLTAALFNNDIHRITTLVIAHGGTELMKLARTCPFLVKLCFMSSGDLHVFVATAPNGALFPPVSVLDLTMDTIPRHPISIPTLRSLTVRVNLTAWFDFMTKATHLLRTFGQIPQLETLQVDITNMLNNDLDETKDVDVRSLGFPALRHLRLTAIGCAVSTCLFILETLQLPPDVRIAVEALHDEEYNNLVQNAVIHSPPDPPSRSRFRPVVSCCVSTTLGCFIMRAWYTSQTVTSTTLRLPALPDPDIHLTLTTVQVSEDEIQRFWQSFPISNIRSLRLGPTSTSDISMLKYLCASAAGEALRELTIVGTLGPMALNFIAAAENAEEVILVEINFTPNKDCSAYISWITFWDLMLDAAEHTYIDGSPQGLVGLCSRRKSAGHPIRRLSITRCQHIAAQDVEKLRGVVEDVYWDGLELDEAIWCGEDAWNVDYYSDEESEYGDIERGDDS